MQKRLEVSSLTNMEMPDTGRRGGKKISTHFHGEKFEIDMR